MDPLFETGVGLWNRSFFVLLGRCERRGDRWRVYRDTSESGVYVEVAVSDVMNQPEDLDYPLRSYDKQPVQALRVRAGAKISAQLGTEQWSGSLDLKDETGVALCQAPAGGTTCVSNLLFEIQGGRPKLIGLCFGKWTLDAPPPNK